MKLKLGHLLSNASGPLGSYYATRGRFGRGPSLSPRAKTTAPAHEKCACKCFKVADSTFTAMPLVIKHLWLLSDTHHVRGSYDCWMKACMHLFYAGLPAPLLPSRTVAWEHAPLPPSSETQPPPCTGARLRPTLTGTAQIELRQSGASMNFVRYRHTITTDTPALVTAVTIHARYLWYPPEARWLYRLDADLPLVYDSGWVDQDIPGFGWNTDHRQLTFPLGPLAEQIRWRTAAPININRDAPWRAYTEATTSQTTTTAALKTGLKAWPITHWQITYATDAWGRPIAYQTIDTANNSTGVATSIILDPAHVTRDDMRAAYTITPRDPRPPRWPPVEPGDLPVSYIIAANYNGTGAVIRTSPNEVRTITIPPDPDSQPA